RDGRDKIISVFGRPEQDFSLPAQAIDRQQEPGTSDIRQDFVQLVECLSSMLVQECQNSVINRVTFRYPCGCCRKTMLHVILPFTDGPADIRAVGWFLVMLRPSRWRMPIVPPHGSIG